ncbi:bifunctional PIG-L family deacetylase/class I SAM-dependent methyltransferase [Kocuria tytonis]|uniref:Methyltransferase domain-containing protein n=1 Tax=Kocuria tytonis TaxID=2054280 RepID=A0A495A2I4_9MICC|nr:bifunctional PIG-L family deacetylase/class I SAM-dependent methyltransferase [Kocuria tytonis]RKQ33732.1 methyltransferase domain-containing protein [Kocuria tytonis]
MVTFDHRDPGTAESDWARCGALHRAPELELTGADRAVVFAAHPDDETLGAGGTVHRLARAGAEVRVVVATLGENSHPGSSTHTPQQLAELRHGEMVAAVRALAGDRAAPVFLSLTDGALAEDELRGPVAEHLDWVQGGENPLVLVTWERDGHTDHEVLARTVTRAAGARGLRCAQFPIWFWHWGSPTRLPRGLVRIPLDDAARSAKRAALEHHATQVRPLSDRPGDEVLLGPHVLAHFERSAEFFVLSAPDQKTVFDRVHTAAEDPWDVDTSWYERRKREVLLGCLPRQRYGTVLDLGCSTGALTVALAGRAGSVVAVDASDVALRAARTRLDREGVTNVELVNAVLPAGWEDRWAGRELIVVSEMGYFCSPEQWEELLDRCVAALEPEGHLVLCHWRHPIEGWPLDGADVHREARRRADLRRVVSHRERDFDLEVFAPVPRGQR